MREQCCLLRRQKASSRERHPCGEMGVSSFKEVWLRHSADEICTLEERDEAETDRQTVLYLNFSCLVLKEEFYVIVS